MKVLLDENLPHAFRHELRGHDVFTVDYQGWRGITNGELLRVAAAAAFDVFITLDVGVQYQQNPATLPVAVLVIRAPSNDIEDLRPLTPLVLNALHGLKPRQVAVIERGVSSGGG
jgi:hypothetical protein